MEQGIDEARLIIEINQESDRLWKGLKHNNLSVYIDKVVGLHQDKGLKVAVVILLGIHLKRMGEIQKMLREKQFAIPVEISIGFLDGSDLKAKFGEKSKGAAQ